MLCVVALLGEPFISNKLATQWDRLAGGVGFDISRPKVLGMPVHGPAGGN